MEKLTIIKISIEDEDFSIEEAIDFLVVTNKIGPDDIDYYKENPQELLSESPNQTISLILKDTTPFKLENKDYEVLIESICDEIGLQGQIYKINFNKRISSSKMEYKVYLRAEEEFKEDNINKCRNFKELILVKGFQASTNYGKVSYADIPKHVLNVAPKEMDLRIITKLLGHNNNVTYICFSDTIYRKFTETLNEDEYKSLPQIDFSDYVEQLEKIVTSQLFRRICTGEYPQNVTKELEHLRNGNYTGAAKLWDVIENILRNIAQNLECTGNSLGEYLDHLSKNNSHRRLFEETKCLVKAIDRNNQAHGRLVRSNSDQKYFAILCMKAIRDVYLNWCFFQSLDLCFSKMSSDLNLLIESLWKIFPNGKIPEKKIIVNNFGEWEAETRFEIVFEDLNTNKKEKFKFNTKLIDNSIISTERVVCNETHY